jgi:sugar transferase (PEP-CTERM/EpsH1 system associated)
LTHTLLDAPEARAVLARLVAEDRPDLVLAYCSGMARFALEPPLDAFPFVLDMVDVDSGKWADLGDQTGQPRRWIYRREARTLAAFEVHAAERAEAVLVVTEREREALRALSPRSSVFVVPNGVDTEAFSPSSPPCASPVVVFTGMMDYGPNVAAVTWFAERVWPQVRAAEPEARFVIVGARPSSAVQALASRDGSVVVTGDVPLVQPYLWDAAVSIAPLQVARGVQNKVLEALAAGLPAVVTGAVAAGLPADVVARGCLVADEPDAFARAVIALLGQPAATRREMAAAAGVQLLSWDRQLAPIKDIVDRARHGAASVGGPRF